MAVLAAALLLGVAAPAVDARLPRAKPFRAGGAITLDTNLLSASGASAWAIDAYLKATTSLPPLGAAFIAAEQKYGVNARFLLAAALHESGWGTGYISRAKHNLFGYNAYDRDPFRYASAYATYAANIEATTKFIKDWYLTSGGRWWGGQPTLRSMQQYWSSSHWWGDSVSRIATSIRLDSIAGRSITFAAPVVGGPLHGGDRATVALSWTGGAVPTGVEFVATWEPILLDADVVAETASTGVANHGSIDAAPSPASAAGPSVVTAAPTGPDPSGPSSVAARRVKSGSRSITLGVAAPADPGTYLLDVEMLDSGRRPLPSAEQVNIPGVEVRVWGDQAVSYDLEPSLDGTGAEVRITNTGRATIPAVEHQPPPAPGNRDPEPARSIVTVTASAVDPLNPAPVSLVVTPLAADLRPGESVTVDVPDVGAATGRTTNWLSVDLSVLGDAAWLGASSPVGAWFADSGLGAAGPMGATARAGVAAAGSPTDVTQTPLPTTAPTPTTVPAPTLTPAATPVPTPVSTPAATPTPAAASMPVPSAAPAVPATRAPASVTRSYSEHSAAISYRGRWGNAPYSGYIGGNVAWSSSPGATATLTFTGSSVSWVGPKGPTRGVALVLLDGRSIARVDLWRPSFVARSVLFRHAFAASGRHTLTITVLSMPSRPYVAIDGFTVGS
jgi:Mannosyl-glycoprotein endo-beta-N-acetylglucosaminidase